jgi:hypothetical protein
MPILVPEKRLSVLASLVDGNSVRATERMTGVNLRTILRFGLLLGAGALNLHNAIAHNLAPPLIEMDEVWSYVAKKQARVTPEEHAAGLGEAYTFVGLGMPSRFAIAWTTGKRDQETADAFIADMRARVVVMPKMMTSDGLSAYITAIGRDFGPGVDYAQVIKNYRKSGRKDDDHRYEPPREPFLTKRAIFGAPNLDAATTAHQERQHGTMRHFIGRMRRLVYAFSKKPENHCAAVALAYCYYNLCWIPRTMRVTPAMAIGAVDHVYDLAEFMDAVLSAKPCECPAVQPLAPRVPETTARALPEGRGFLRVVPGSGAPAAPAPGQGEPPPAAPAAAPVESVADPTGQLDLLSWRPRPVPPPPPEPAKRLPMTQLDLFGIEFDPEPVK